MGESPGHKPWRNSVRRLLRMRCPPEVVADDPVVVGESEPAAAPKPSLRVFAWAVLFFVMPWRWPILRPWEMPRDFPKFEDMTRDELVAEAQGQPRLLGAMATHMSAAANQKVMCMQFERAAAMFHINRLRRYVIPYLWVIACVPIGCGLLYGAWNASPYANERNWIQVAVMLGIVGGALYFAFWFGLKWMARCMFPFAHAGALIVQDPQPAVLERPPDPEDPNDEGEPYRPSKPGYISLVPLLRLRTLNNTRIRYTGSGLNASVAKGDVILKPPVGVDISEGIPLDQISRWESTSGTFQGVHAGMKWNRANEAILVGRMDPRAVPHNPLADVVRRFPGTLFLAGCVVAVIVILAIGSGSPVEVQPSGRPQHPATGVAPTRSAPVRPASTPETAPVTLASSSSAATPEYLIVR